ncbi:hypothetical protein Bca4012_043189 [Brassica carinata]|uniref:Uncharacterized protein n=1 Tax=Brassica carinata TaxID=52824 RepID=A0A8X7UFD8_BRACI|nr:hypothetical protein Bca52824_059139 [Brassica carinata]
MQIRQATFYENAAETSEDQVKRGGEQTGNRGELATHSRESVPYEQPVVSRSDGKTDEKRSPVITVTRRLASTIVTPSRADHPMEENVTKRVKESTRSLTFAALSDQELQDGVGDGQIIGALSDMEIADQHDGEMMDCYVRNDDLLGLKLTEMENLSSRRASLKEAGRSADKSTRKNLRFFVGDLRGSVRLRLMLMQENLGATTKVQKSLGVVRQQVKD